MTYPTTPTRWQQPVRTSNAKLGRRSPWWTFRVAILGIGLACAMLMLAGCGLPADVRLEVDRCIEAGRMVAEDPTSTAAEVSAGWAAHDAGWAMLYGAGEADEVPDAVRARSAARKQTQEEARAAALERAGGGR